MINDYETKENQNQSGLKKIETKTKFKPQQVHVVVHISNMLLKSGLCSNRILSTHSVAIISENLCIQ